MQTHYIRLLITILFASLVFSGCDTNTATDPGPVDVETNISEEARTVSQLGWQTVHQINTEDQFSNMVSGSDELFKDDPDMLNTIGDIKAQHDVYKVTHKRMLKEADLSILKNDSLIWFEEWNDSLSGTAGTRAFYYDSETEIARVYEVVRQFPASVKLEYDSTTIRAFVGPDLNDDSDDRLLSVFKESRFVADFPVATSVSSIEATDWDASNEVIGATLTNTLTYNGQGELETLSQNGTLRPDGSVSISERLDYDDGTFHSNAVNINADHTGDVSQVWRDGTTVNGTFDGLEDDNHARVTQTIDFASHPLVDRLEHEAEYSFNPDDSSSSGLLREKVVFVDGQTDSARIEIDHYLQDGYWRSDFDIQTANDGSSQFSVTCFDTYKEVIGTYTAPGGEYARYNGVEYEGGNGELWISIWANEQAYIDGEDPILTAHFIYNGDGSGSGTITEAGKTYQVTFTPDGEITMVDDEGNSETNSAY